MTYITMVEVNDRKLAVSKKHYKEVLEMLNKGNSLSEENEELDCGYLFVDRENKILVSNQFGFALNHLDETLLKELRKKWHVLEI